MCSYSYGNIDAVELKTRSIHLGIGTRHAGKHSEPLFYLPFAVLLVGMARLFHRHIFPFLPVRLAVCS